MGVGVPANGVFVGMGVGVPAKGVGVFGVPVGDGGVGVAVGRSGVGLIAVELSPEVGVCVGGVPVTTGVGVIGIGFGSVGAGVGIPANGVEVGVGENFPLPGSVGVWHPGSPESTIPIASVQQKSAPRLRSTDAS